MSNIAPIPNTRVSGLLLRERLTQQYQADQLDLFRIQEQISTGRRITLPSDDAPAALRAISLQRLIERKGQLEININTGQSFLAATDTALNQVADVLNQVKSATLGVVGNVTSQQDRDTAIATINETLNSLVNLANRQFRGRQLFGGSNTNELPYTFDGNNVTYNGNDQSLRSYSDLGVLFATNATGQEVFGGISEAVTGSVDLNPQLNLDTPLSSLRGGRGINPNGAFVISDGQATSVVDISSATTIGDVIRRIEENPPAGRDVEVSITGTGLTISIDGGSLSISEIAGGSTARELGILKTADSQLSVTGTDLDPILLLTDRLDNLLGTKARTVIESGGQDDNNDILLQANSNGLELDGVAIQYVDDSLLYARAGLASGNELAEYDPNARAATAALTFSGSGNDLIITAPTGGTAYNDVQINIRDGGAVGDAATATYNSGTNTLDITVDNTGATTTQTVIDAIATTGFTAVHDDSVEATFIPSTTIDAADIGVVRGNTGNSGGEAKTLYIRIDPGQSTANQVLEAINTEGTFTAAIDASDSSSLAASGTGAVNLNATPALTSGGSGSTLDQTSGIRVTNGGETYDITFEAAETVQDLLNILNGSGAGLLAEVNAKGTGINIRSRLSGNVFQIGELGGQTATQLGIRTLTADTKLGDLNFDIGLPTKADSSTDITLDTITIKTSDGNEFANIDLSAATNLTDVINLINTATTTNVTAQLNSDSSGIEFIDNTSGLAALSVSQTGADIPITGGVSAKLPSDDIAVTSIDGQVFRVDLSDSKTIGDAIDAINAATGGAVVARLAQTGNGIELEDQTAGPGALTVTELGGSQAGEFLGFVASGETEKIVAGNTLVSEDRRYQETDSVFNTLISLRAALEQDDTAEITRTAAKLDIDVDRVVFARSDVGARARGLAISSQNLQQEEIQLRSALSDEIDVDLVEAISQLTARQISLEASLRATANILQLSLLNFI